VEIIDRLYRIPRMIGNVYLIVEPGGLTLIDAGAERRGKRILNYISLFAPSVGVLFSGDSVISRNGSLYPSRGANTWDEAQALESMRVQAALGARIVCPGHGPVVKEDELTAGAWAGRSMQR
jgi:glyoxylase-like metal-dependent hydrolase (beta-lactamase superfamily II)